MFSFLHIANSSGIRNIVVNFQYSFHIQRVLP
nr:MAG TPA: hypothetical protein [Caudoviricetes sp.]